MDQELRQVAPDLQVRFGRERGDQLRFAQGSGSDVCPLATEGPFRSVCRSLKLINSERGLKKAPELLPEYYVGRDEEAAV